MAVTLDHMHIGAQTASTDTLLDRIFAFTAVIGASIDAARQIEIGKRPSAQTLAILGIDAVNFPDMPKAAAR